MSQDNEVRKRYEMTEESSPDKEEMTFSSSETMKTSSEFMLNRKRKWLIFNTHLNAAIYSSCFWVQIGVLPVSLFIFTKYIVSDILSLNGGSDKTLDQHI